MAEIFQCTACKEYTLKEAHCEYPTQTPHPPKFSVQDKWQGLVRQAKEEQRKKQGLI